MHFTLQQLKLFESVSRHASYTRAAEELHLTQPAVSIQLKRLEQQVGLPLFEVVGKKIFPTVAGNTLYQASCDLLQRAEQLKRDVETLKGEIKGLLQLSVITSSKYFMPHILGEFLNQHPDVEPKMIFTNRSRVLQRLINNDDDFVVMGRPPKDEKVQAYPFLENILVPTAHPSHPLAGKKGIDLSELIQYRYLDRELGSGTRMVFDRTIKQAGLTVEPYMELGSGEAIKQAVMAGLGFSILSSHSIQLELAANKLVVLDVKGFPITRSWYVVHQQGKKLSLVAQTFLEYMLAETRAISDITDTVSNNRL